MTCLLAVQVAGVPYLAGDTRITMGDSYFDGTPKVFKVNDRVLVGASGNAYNLDVLKTMLGSLKGRKTALEAARALEQAFLKSPRARDMGEYDFLFISRNQAVHFEEDGILEEPFNNNVAVSAGAGGIVALSWWEAAEYQRENDSTESVLEDAVTTASRHRTDCGPEVLVVHC